MMTSTKINRIASTVTTWITPPECQGQTVEISYGTSDEGDVMVREIDHSGPETRYGIVRGVDSYEPWNGAPTGEIAWA